MSEGVAEEAIGAARAYKALHVPALARRADAGIAWCRGRAEALPWDDGSFDAVVSQFGLMYFPDPDAALREMLRVLRPDGRIGVAVWASLDHTEVYPELVDLLDRMAGDRAAAALRAPFALGDADRLARLLRSAGAGDVRVTQQPGRAHFPSLRAFVEAELRGWLPLMGIALEESRIAEILAASEATLARYVEADGALDFAAPALVASGLRYPAGHRDGPAS